tara:strand:- start:131 stop:289 length:159 start_codon:yes stop_codon:yes gene_type:complete
MTIKELWETQIELSLKRFGSVKKAAQSLKITEKTIYNYLNKKNGIQEREKTI